MIARYRRTISYFLFVVAIVGADVAVPDVLTATCCSGPEYLVEIVVNSCQRETAFRRAALTAQVYSQARLLGQPQLTLGTENEQLERFEPPVTREYFFPFDDPNVCQELTSHAPLVFLTQMGSSCNWHDRSECKILKPLPIWLLELQRKYGT